MKHIAKPLKNNDKNNIFRSFNWKDILFAMTIFCIFFSIAIPLIINSEMIAAIIVIIVAATITGALLIKFGDMKLYMWIYNLIRFQFTKVNDCTIDFVDEIKGNLIKLKDEESSSFRFYRIIGKDISLLNADDMAILSDNLSKFFEDNSEIDIFKIDSQINFNNISVYLKQLLSNKTYKDEIKEQINILNKLKSDSLTSISEKYFISIKCDDSLDVSDRVNQLRSLLNSAELDLIEADEGEMVDIKNKLYFNNIQSFENRKYVEIVQNEIDPLTILETDIKESLSDNEVFNFRGKLYKRENKKYLTLTNDKTWEECNNPFELTIANKKYVTFIALKSFPQSVDYGWLSTLLNMKGVDVNIKIKNSKNENVEKMLTRVLESCEAEYENLSNTNVVKAKKVEEDLKGYKELSEALSNGKEIKTISCLLKIESDDASDLTNKVKDIYKKLKRIGYDLSRLEFNQFDALKEFFANSSKGINFLEPIECLDSILGYGFPFTQQEIADKKGLYFGLNETKTPLFIDWKKMDNLKNSSSMILLGKTGSGKSTSARRILKNQIISDEYKTFIIDPENEYGEMLKKYGGITINVNNGKQIINPFDLNLTGKETEEEYYDVVNDKIIFLENFLKIVFQGKITDENLSWLNQQIYELYLNNIKTRNKKQITFSSLYSHIKKVADSSKKDTVAQIGYFATVAGGNKAYLWDQETNIDTNNNYIVFEFKEMLAKGTLTPTGAAQMFLVLQYLNNIVLKNRYEGARYINIVVDEAHLLMKPKYLQIVEFMNEMYKRIRKYNGMMTLITQNIEDFYIDEIKEYTKALINNAFWIIAHTIKSQEIPKLDELMAEQGGLKKAEKEFLMSPKQGQCILIYNNNRTKVSVQK